MKKYTSVNELVGKTLKSVEQVADDEIIFTTAEGRRFNMYHDQDCCERVYIEDICGDLQDLVGSPIIQAEESSNSDNPLDPYEDSFTWTFYRLTTMKGQVVIRWYGSSNGYYSEAVDFCEL